MTALTLLLFATAAIGVAFAAVVYRADPRRWDNVVFATLGMVDAAMALLRAVAVFGGTPLADIGLGRVCAILSTVLAWLTVEFAWSFPRSKPAPWHVRAVVLTLMSVSMGLLCAPIWRWYMSIASVTFFLPLFAFTILLMVRTLRRTEGAQAAAVRLVLAAFILRWAWAMLTYAGARNLSLDAFAVALTIDATAAVLASFVLIGYAVLSGHLFRVRGVLAEVTVSASLALSAAAATWAAIEAVLAWSRGRTETRLLLFAAAFLPLALYFVGRALRARLEQRVLATVDPRRAVRAGVVERVLRGAEREADPRSAIAGVCSALTEITVGGTARLLAAPGRRVPGSVGELSAAEAVSLAPPEVRHVASDARLLIAVRAGGVLHGALSVEGGQLDRDSLLAGIVLANHLGVKLENHMLFAELEESRRLATLGSFAAAIAHDIRTPLASVQMNVQILRGKVSLPADDMEHFDIALEELGRLNAGISELLDYAKPVKLAPAALEVRELADDAARGIAPVLSERRVDLKVEVPEGLPQVRADAGRLRQVLLNLLDNAAKASAPGAAVVLRGAQAEGGRIAIEVADRGKGISPAELPRIFEPFYTTRPDGTGLGLAIVQKIVRAHAGDVVVRSTPGEGSSFTVLLPAA